MALLPPFCPRKTCPNHHTPTEKKWFHKIGWYETKASGRVKRFICRSCGKSFSEQTFRLSYYLHKKISFRDIFVRISSCSGIRALARSFQVTDKVISNRVGRLARQAMGMMASLRTSQRFSEHVAADGFESFIHSQYSPNNIHHLIGTESQYVYACDLAHIRRKGRMTEYQQRKRRRLEHKERLSGEIRTSFRRICHTLQDLALHTVKLTLYTDEKQEYKAVLRENRYLDGKIIHRTTSARQARTFHNPLWPVNYYDRELRKDLSSMTRETTRWSQETNNCMERMYLYAGYHNFFKPFRIKQRGTKTHAEVAGFEAKRLRSLLATFFTERFFFSRIVLSVSEWWVWLRAYRTPFRPSFQSIPAYITGEERLSALARAA
jgi:hypothetical protein